MRKAEAESGRGRIRLMMMMMTHEKIARELRRRRVAAHVLATARVRVDLIHLSMRRRLIVHGAEQTLL
jgi:hypothetical protein